MSSLQIDSEFTMHYLVDDYTDPWMSAQCVLMIHGNAECAQAWYGWVPQLSRHYRLVRPDSRGFGASTPMPREFPWTIDRLIDDFLVLMDSIGVARFHLVAAKFGGTIARRFAARCPDRVRSLVLAGTPPPAWDRLGVSPAAAQDELERLGVEAWARKNMAGRLGSSFSHAGLQWWTRMMGRTSLHTMLGFSATMPYTDIRADLPQIRCPTLVITTEGSALGSVEATRAWQQCIPDSELLVVPGDSYHVAASDPGRCAAATLDFFRRVPPDA